MSIIKKLTWIVVMIGVLSLSFYSGELYYKKFRAPIPSPQIPAGIDPSIIWQTWQKVQSNYYGQINYQKMIYGATAGMVKSLGDPYTVFLDPQESKEFNQDINGQFGGIGIEIGLKDNNFTVITPLDKSPAQRAGIKAGDIITQVDDKPTENLSIDELVSLVRGKKGTKVKITIARKDEKDGKIIVKTFNIIRDKISIPAVEWKMLKNNIAYIKIYQFPQNLTPNFDKIAFQIIKSPAKKIILDLRNNPGGLVDQVQNVGGYFLERGDVITIEKGKDNKKIKDYRARGNESLLKYPLAVLINKGSASGAEILALALRDNRKTPLIGETSFGKGSVQEMMGLRDKATLKITIAHWFGPENEQINKIGIKPTIEVKIPENTNNDPQLKKAIEILNKQ